MNQICQIGYGSIGQRHYKNLKKLGMDYVAGADPDVSRVRAPKAYEVARRCLGEHAKDNLVVIASPTKYHLEQMDIAEHYGAKAIFIEKPPHYNYQELKEYKHGKTPTAVGFNYRFHPYIQELKNVTTTGRLFMLAYDDVAKWPTYNRTSWMTGEHGGCLLTSVTHSIDTAIYLLGPVVAVSGGLGYNKDIGDSDTAVSAKLLHANGSKTTIAVSWEAPKMSALIYAGNDNIIAVHNMLSHKHDMHLEEMRAFLLFAEGLPTELCTLEESLAVMEVVDSIRNSARMIAHE